MSTLDPQELKRCEMERAWLVLYTLHSVSLPVPPATPMVFLTLEMFKPEVLSSVLSMFTPSVSLRLGHLPSRVHASSGILSRAPIFLITEHLP